MTNKEVTIPLHKSARGCLIQNSPRYVQTGTCLFKKKKFAKIVFLQKVAAKEHALFMVTY